MPAPHAEAPDPAVLRRVSEMVTSLADPTANIIFGAVIDKKYAGQLHVTIIATGFSASVEENILNGKVVPPSPPALPTQAQPTRLGHKSSHACWFPRATATCSYPRELSPLPPPLLADCAIVEVVGLGRRLQREHGTSRCSQRPQCCSKSTWSPSPSPSPSRGSLAV